MISKVGNCQGPCLFHCYYKHSILLLFIGILIGYFLYKWRRTKHLDSKTN